MNEEPRPLRCAIYTRKSTEEGLQQQFNSLQAQREAAEAYIASQRHSGWIALPVAYDDGGFSGATIDRPALKQLLADIDQGGIDCIVVYKVDRLSRSLLDFARLMAVFEEKKISFVSVTQEFNTTTSLGRLTLNILLSFAQFEREIISERTRDKLGAARRKGKWIGGTPVLGYDVHPEGGRLIVNAEEARCVRAIFDIAAESESLTATLREVNARGYRTKEWKSRRGGEHKGKTFGKNTLGILLRNVLYMGDISHKGVRYPGEQEALVSPELWESVNRKLNMRSQSQTGRSHREQDAALRGILCCGQCGSHLAPTHTTRRGVRHLYYFCPATARGKCEQRPVAAKQMEAAIARVVRNVTPGQINRETLQRTIESLRYDSRTRELTMALWDGTRSTIRIEPGMGSRDMGEDAEQRRAPRISRVMALAIKLESLVQEGRVANYATLAESGHISRARMSHLMMLNQLAPPIQEALLFLPPQFAGPDRITERKLRPIAQHVDWAWQMKLFQDLLRETGATSHR